MRSGANPTTVRAFNRIGGTLGRSAESTVTTSAWYPKSCTMAICFSAPSRPPIAVVTWDHSDVAPDLDASSSKECPDAGLRAQIVPNRPAASTAAAAPSGCCSLRAPTGANNTGAVIGTPRMVVDVARIGGTVAARGRNVTAPYACPFARIVRLSPTPLLSRRYIARGRTLRAKASASATESNCQRFERR